MKATVGLMRLVLMLAAVMLVMGASMAHSKHASAEAGGRLGAEPDVAFVDPGNDPRNNNQSSGSGHLSPSMPNQGEWSRGGSRELRAGSGTSSYGKEWKRFSWRCISRLIWARGRLMFWTR